VIRSRGTVGSHHRSPGPVPGSVPGTRRELLRRRVDGRRLRGGVPRGARHPGAEVAERDGPRDATSPGRPRTGRGLTSKEASTPCDRPATGDQARFSGTLYSRLRLSRTNPTIGVSSPCPLLSLLIDCSQRFEVTSQDRPRTALVGESGTTVLGHPRERLGRGPHRSPLSLGRKAWRGPAKEARRTALKVCQQSTLKVVSRASRRCHDGSHVTSFTVGRVGPPAFRMLSELRK